MNLDRKRVSEATTISNYLKAQLDHKSFQRFSTFIQDHLGIKMPAEKKGMLEARLQKRLKTLGMNDYSQYEAYVFGKNQVHQELIHMIDVVTTNKTDFFREPIHFDFLEKVILPTFVNESPRNTFTAWSAGCSSGDEVYTLAMTISRFLTSSPLQFDYSILGTDISQRMLLQAEKAIYPMDKVKEVPLDMKKDFMLKSKNTSEQKIRIVPELRNKVKFSRLNLMDESYPVDTDLDLILCRNVMIYFERKDQEKVIRRLCKYLKSGGYLFIGHSESILELDVPLTSIKPTIYKKTE